MALIGEPPTHPSGRISRPPKYVTDPQHWEYDGVHFDGREKTPPPETASELAKIVITGVVPDTDPGTVWQTAMWTEERTGGGPGDIYASFLDAVESFDNSGFYTSQYYEWAYMGDGEWSPRFEVEDGEVSPTDESAGMPRVIAAKIIPDKRAAAAALPSPLADLKDGMKAKLFVATNDGLFPNPFEDDGDTIPPGVTFGD